MFKEKVQKLLSLQLKKNKGEASQWQIPPKPLSTVLEENLERLKEVFARCDDIVFREIEINAGEPISGAILYFKGITDEQMIAENILNPLLHDHPESGEKNLARGEVLDYIRENLSSVSEIELAGDLSIITQGVTHAKLALLLDKVPTALLIDAPNKTARAIMEPDSEPVVRGPKDGFVESLSVNIMLLRRRLRTSYFKVETFNIGELSSTQVAVCYIQGVANEKVVEEVKKRLKRIKIDGIVGSGYIEELIRDEPVTLFPLVFTTERPDRVAASLLEGRVTIMVDNTPMNLIVPCTFISMLQASEDYYIAPEFATFVRFLRFISLNISLMFPAVTVAIFSFHQELIPRSLLATVAGARQELPFPIFMEIFIMEITFEILREAGVRLPKTVGQAISTVGGLVIGQAAVNAGFVSPLSVIVVALTAIASFTIPNYTAGSCIRISRFFLLICSGLLGLIGMMFGLMAMLFHLCSLRSFGVPYLTPITPYSLRDLKDTLVRVPWWAMITRPRLIEGKEPERQERGQGPQKLKGGGNSHQ